MNKSASDQLLADSGKIDLTNSPPNELIPLNGEWTFYWNQLLFPDEIQQHRPTTIIPLPKLWSNFVYEGGKAFPKQGYGTFLLTLNIHEQEVGKQKAIYMPTFLTAYKLYIDGKQMGKMGEVGISKETMKPKFSPQVITFIPKSKEVSILIQTSNFYHIKSGVQKEILYGDAELVIAFKEKAVAKNGFLFAIFILISLYHFLFYLNRKHEIRSLTFALFSFVIAVRILVIDQILLIKIFPDFNWTLEMKIEYLTVFFGFWLFIIFLKTLYPKESIAYIYRFSLLLTSGFSLLVIFTPPIVFVRLLKPFGFVSFLLVIYFLYVMFIAMIRKREGARISFFTGLFFYMTIVNDMLHYNGFIQSIDLVPIGFFIFLFSQFLLLSQEYAKSFNEADQLNTLLQELNAKLEDRVEYHKESLEQSMHETAVALTDKFILEERTRLIGEIHDTVGHTLTTIIIQIEAGKRLIHTNPTIAKEKLDMSQEQIRKGLNEIRNSLRLLNDRDQGSIEYLFSLRTLIYDTEKSTGVTIKSDIKLTKSLSAKHQVVLYRALQEGLTNGIRHGNSNFFSFHLNHSDDWITFRLEDNGEGVAEIKYGLGLSMMKERVEDLNGELYIQSEKGKGFNIEIFLPFE